MEINKVLLDWLIREEKLKIMRLTQELEDYLVDWKEWNTDLWVSTTTALNRSTQNIRAFEILKEIIDDKPYALLSYDLIGKEKRFDEK